MSVARTWPLAGCHCPRLPGWRGPHLVGCHRQHSPDVTARTWPDVIGAQLGLMHPVLIYHGGGGRVRRGPCVRNRVNFRLRAFRVHVGDSVDTRVLLSSPARALLGFRSPRRPIRRRSVVGRIRRRRADGGGWQELPGSASIPRSGTGRKATRVAARTLRFRGRAAPWADIAALGVLTGTVPSSFEDHPVAGRPVGRGGPPIWRRQICGRWWNPWVPRAEQGRVVRLADGRVQQS
jgi:hypothetical protein